VIRHHPDKLGRAIAQAAAGHHYITYTRNVVIPALQGLMPAHAEPEPAPAA